MKLAGTEMECGTQVPWRGITDVTSELEELGYP